MKLRRLFCLGVMAALAGLTAADAGGNQLFFNSLLLRDTRQEVVTVPIPPLQTAECVRGRIQGEVVRMVTFHAHGNAALDLHLSDFGLGIFLREATLTTLFEEVLIERVGALNFQTGHLPPGTIVTFIFIDPVDTEIVTSDTTLIDLLQTGSRVEYAVGGGGGSVGCSGSCGIRLGADISARFELEVFD